VLVLAGDVREISGLRRRWRVAVDLGPVARRAGELRVVGEQRHSQQFGEGHVHAVIGGQVVAQLQHAWLQRQHGMPDDLELRVALQHDLRDVGSCSQVAATGAVARDTVQKAIKHLRELGYVYTVPNWGNVSSLPPDIWPSRRHDRSYTAYRYELTAWSSP